MDTTTLVVTIAVVAVVVGVVLLVAARVHQTRRSAALRGVFGAEYDRVVAEQGGRQQGETELRSRLRRRRSLSVRSLDDDQRTRHTDGWSSAERTFIDTPATALREADQMVTKVMADRGYPVETFKDRADMVSVDHPDLVEHFRTAHDIAVSGDDDTTDTEGMRQAMVDHRFLFDELLEGGRSDAARRP